MYRTASEDRSSEMRNDRDPHSQLCIIRQEEEAG